MRILAWLLISLLIIQPMTIHAADVGASGWTCFEGDGIEPGDGTTGDPTIDSGSNRRLIYLIWWSFAGSVSASVFTVGGETFDETFNNLVTDVDSVRISAWVWNEATIGSMSGNTVSYTDNGGAGISTQICWAIITDGEQSDLVDWDNEVDCTACTTDDVATTSSAGDYVILPAANDINTVAFSTWDTLTEIADVNASFSRFALGAGDGGDNTTTVTVASSVDLMLDSLVIVDEPAVNTALLRRRGR
jgi:hypothetical protein